jgi:hypothetical protein
MDRRVAGGKRHGRLIVTPGLVETGTHHQSTKGPSTPDYFSVPDRQKGMRINVARFFRQYTFSKVPRFAAKAAAPHFSGTHGPAEERQGNRLLKPGLDMSWLPGQSLVGLGQGILQQCGWRLAILADRLGQQDPRREGPGVSIRRICDPGQRRRIVA